MTCVRDDLHQNQVFDMMKTTGTASGNYTFLENGKKFIRCKTTKGTNK